MATSDLLKGRTALPELILHDVKESIDAEKIAREWLSTLLHAFQKDTLSATSDLFVEHSWWRDLVCLSWDITSKNGPKDIVDYLQSSKLSIVDLTIIEAGALMPQLSEMGPMTCLQAAFSIETNVGRGRGILRLANTQPNQWKAWTISTVLEQLKTHEREEISKRKSDGLQGHIITQHGHTDDDLQVLIVGAGQSSLALAAHLQELGIRYLVVEKGDGVGSQWEKRYDSIKSHTPSDTDHFPFLKYPSHWPVWLDKPRILSWIKNYAQLMDLNIQLKTAVTEVRYSAESQNYSVQLSGEKGERIIKSRHLVQATGLLSALPNRPSFPGESALKGDIFHSSLYKTGNSIKNLANRKILLIGSGTSAFDIAQDLVNNGAKSVSMLQRHPTFVTSLDSASAILYGTWTSGFFNTEEADLVGTSFPTPIVRKMGDGLTMAMAYHDQDLLNQLEGAGLGIKRGEDGITLLDHALLLGGHFYHDQGACKMIIDGQIKIHRCESGVREFTGDGVILGNGKKVQADTVILCTGFKRSSEDVRNLMGVEIADRVGGDQFGHLDNVQERIGLWKPTGQPGYWFMTGSFQLSRQFAPLLAMQIKGVEDRINEDYYSQEG